MWAYILVNSEKNVKVESEPCSDSVALYSFQNFNALTI